MDKQLDLAVIGECLIEFSASEKLEDADVFRKSYGGDSVISAIMASKLGTETAFITKLGNDGFGHYIYEQLQKDNIDTSNIEFLPEQNGVYIAARPAGGKNEFYYYKRKSAATKLNDDDITEELLSSFKCLYSTGVTQSLSLSARNAVKKAFRIAKEKELITAYDPNYTSCFMYSDESKEFLEEILPYTNIIFMSMKNDAEHLFESLSYEHVARKLGDFGVETIVIKSRVNGGYYIFYNGEMRFIEFFNKLPVIDLTASGDAFNGAFLHSVISGFNPFEAAKYAAVAAGLQTSKTGAVSALPSKDEIAEYL